jgi:hypothetical protein
MTSGEELSEWSGGYCVWRDVRINKAVTYTPFWATFHTPSCVSIPPSRLYFSLAYLTVISGEVEYTFSASPFLFLYVCFWRRLRPTYFIYKSIYMHIYIYIHIHIYMNRKRGERIFLDSSRPAVIFNTSFYISVFLPYAYWFYFMYTIRLYVLPKSYTRFIYWY